MKKYIFILLAASSLLNAESGKMETGIKLGYGINPPGRFEQNLGNYHSNSVVPGNTSVNYPGDVAHSEILFNIGLDSRYKLGFALGYTGFGKYTVSEWNLWGEYTTLGLGMNTTFAMFTWHYERPVLQKNYSMEAGFGIGFNQTAIAVSGWRKSIFGLREISGRLEGTGLQFMADASINRKMSDMTKLKLGIQVNRTVVDFFDGVLNDSGGSFYIQGDGTLSQMSFEQFASYQNNNQNFGRKIDLDTATAVLYLAGFLVF